MKKLITTILLLGTTTVVCTAQSSNRAKKYVYTETTSESFEELNRLTNSNRQLREKALLRYELAELKGQIVLSNKQYAPIKSRIAKAPVNPMTEVEEEEKVYADKAKQRYIPVSQLLK